MTGTELPEPVTMPYEYLDHLADIGISAWGGSMEEALREGARALFGVMCDPETVEAENEVAIRCEAREESLLFVEMLNALLRESSLGGLLFRDLIVDRLVRTGEGFLLDARARGEAIDADKHELGTEVKAATYSGLRYRREADLHYFQCLLDI